MSMDIKEIIQRQAGTFNKDFIDVQLCTVDAGSVNDADGTCDCTPVGGNAQTPLKGVQLLADVPADGFMLIPADGSTVLVGITLRNENYILMASELRELFISIPNAAGTKWTTYSVTDGLQQFNDGSFGGLCKAVELQTQLAKNNAYITALQAATLQLATVLDGIVPGTLTAYNATMAGQVLGDYSQIINALITHGK